MSVVPVDEARRQIAAATTERDFQAQVVTLARLAGWMTYHTHDARRSPAGFPDLVCLRPGSEDRAGSLVFLELKAERGRVSPDQADWLAALATVPGVRTVVWRPSDWPAIEASLRRE